LELPEEMRKQQIEAYESPEAAEFVVRNVLTATVLGDEVVKELVEDMMRGNEWAKKAWPDYGMGEDILEDVEGVRLPVLVITGELDKVETVERVRREVLENLKGEKDMVVIEKVGHLLPLEAPERVAGLIEGFVGKVVEAQAERLA
jgi:3-oxoadipate enol-lactonase